MRPLYTEKEVKDMSPKLREISNLTEAEWCQRWDGLTAKIRKRYKQQIQEINRRKREEK